MGVCHTADPILAYWSIFAIGIPQQITEIQFADWVEQGTLSVVFFWILQILKAETLSNTGPL